MGVMPRPSFTQLTKLTSPSFVSGGWNLRLKAGGSSASWTANWARAGGDNRSRICEMQTMARDPSETGTPGDDTSTETEVSSDGSKQKVLIVDDDFEIVDAIRYALQGEGFEVVVARDGNQGLALAERENPDLMILDMMMPKRSGFLVLEKLRRLRDTPLPVIMITGNEGSRHKAYAELLGVSDYLRKPFAMDRLIAAVNRLLDQS
jgi:CheY-like chemotaxis protein